MAKTSLTALSFTPSSSLTIRKKLTSSERLWTSSPIGHNLVLRDCKKCPGVTTMLPPSQTTDDSLPLSVKSSATRGNWGARDHLWCIDMTKMMLSSRISLSTLIKIEEFIRPWQTPVRLALLPNNLLPRGRADLSLGWMLDAEGIMTDSGGDDDLNHVWHYSKNLRLGSALIKVPTSHIWEWGWVRPSSDKSCRQSIRHPNRSHELAILRLTSLRKGLRLERSYPVCLFFSLAFFCPAFRRLRWPT